MGESKSTPRRRVVQVAPGVQERHSPACKGGGRRACTCRPQYFARVSYGPRGQSRRATATLPNLAEAVAWVNATKAAFAAGATSPARRAQAPAFKDAAVSFLVRARKGEVLSRARKPYSENTILGYESALRRHVLDHIDSGSGLAFGVMPVDAIDVRMVQGLLDHLAVNASNEVARLAAASVHAVQMFAYATLRALDAPPVKPVLPPPHARRERALSVPEADAVIAAAQQDDERFGRSLALPLVALLIGSGLRIAEALALEWGPAGLDLEAEPAAVRVSSGKTKAATRLVTLDRRTAQTMRAHYLASGRPENGTPVFAGRNGQPYTRSGAPRAALERIRKATGLADVGFHVARHTHATWLASAQLPDVALAARMGHGDASFTKRRYAHAMQVDLDRAPGMLDAIRDAHSEAG